MASPFVEIGILIILLLAFLRYRNDPRLEITRHQDGARPRPGADFLLPDIQFGPAPLTILTGVRIFGMFIVNMVLLYHLLLARLLRPYHNALSSMTQKPEDCQLIPSGMAQRQKMLLCATPGLPCSAGPTGFISSGKSP